MKELRKRLKVRGRETDEQIDERIEAARWEFEQSQKYNYLFVNDDLDECVKKIEETMKQKIQGKNLVNKLLAE